ncbi:MAG: OmpA family protein, partial [Alistipes sp.]
EMPDRKIAIKGYADKTGTDQINSELSQERADALQAYLEGHGIDASRIVSAQGYGADQDLPGEEGFSVMARRAQVVNK